MKLNTHKETVKTKQSEVKQLKAVLTEGKQSAQIFLASRSASHECHPRVSVVSGLMNYFIGIRIRYYEEKVRQCAIRSKIITNAPHP